MHRKDYFLGPNKVDYVFYSIIFVLIIMKRTDEKSKQVTKSPGIMSQLKIMVEVFQIFLVM